MTRSVSRVALRVLAAFLMISVFACSTGPLRPDGASPPRGRASWYGKAFDGKKTASGERFDSRALTAAHRTLAFGTHVRVTAVDSGRSVVVRINDRGPFAADRVIDVSQEAARQLGMLAAGTIDVELTIVR